MLKSTSVDEIDGVFAGESFKIRYLGRTDITGSAKFNFEEIANEIVSQYSKTSLSKLLHLDLIIDSTLVVIRDNDRQRESTVLFSIPLSNVRDTFYIKNDKRYEKLCIFVARDAPHYTLKAHVLLCDSPLITTKIFESFQNAFIVTSTMNSSKRRKDLRSHQDKIQPHLTSSTSSRMSSKMTATKEV